MHWQFGCDGDALKTNVGRREKGRIAVAAWRGRALEGPALAVPAGRVHARIQLAPGGMGRVFMDITHRRAFQPLASGYFHLRGQRAIQLEVELAGPIDDLQVRLFCRGPCRFAITGLELELVHGQAWRPLDPARPVGIESGKSYAEKIREGFFDRYLSGPAVMEVGYKGYHHETVPIVPQAIGVDIGYPGYEDNRFPFADNSLDAIYSSHCFEHIADYRAVLRDWYRLLKIGGFLVIIVPHQHLFERKRQMPSRWNGDHKRFYTSRSLLAEVESALDENSYRIRHLVENDAGFTYDSKPREGAAGCFEIELVVEKIRKPGWVLDDGTVRPYLPGEFHRRPDVEQRSQFECVLKLDEPGRPIWGPYTQMGAGDYEAEFFFDGMPDRDIDLLLEVARDQDNVAKAEVRLAAGSDRHRFVLPFVNDRDDALYEFRVKNNDAHPGCALIFRGVDLRYARSG